MPSAALTAAARLSKSAEWLLKVVIGWMSFVVSKGPPPRKIGKLIIHSRPICQGDFFDGLGLCGGSSNLVRLMDQMLSPSVWLEVLKVAPGIVTAMTAVAAVFYARAGVEKWHRETIGKRKAELAEQALAGMYEARDVFQSVRSRVVFFGEGENLEPNQNDSKKIRARRSRYSVPIERLQRDKDLFARLQSQRYSFAAYFGSAAVQPFTVISEVHQEIMSASGILIEMAAHEDFSESAYNDSLDGLKNTIGWGSAKRPDDIDRKIDAAIVAVEATCRPVLIEAPPRAKPLLPTT